MQPYPHLYRAEAQIAVTGGAAVSSPGLPPLETAAPPEFGGPGGAWSPETLLTAAVADCFALGFRAIAAASKFSWTRLRCEVEGVLDRVEGVARFTELRIRAELTLPSAEGAERARRLLEKAEKACLVTNSLIASPALECRIEVEGQGAQVGAGQGA